VSTSLKNNPIFNKRTSEFARMIIIANINGDEAYNYVGRGLPYKTD